jgi:hypothetical protein
MQRDVNTSVTCGDGTSVDVGGRRETVVSALETATS